MVSRSPIPVAAALLAAVLGLGHDALAQDAVAAARAEHAHILMRHAIAPGTGDPANFELGDCSTQRNLSDEGRRQARRVGEKLRASGIPVDVVLTSQWCRARETAELLGVGEVEAFPALNSFFEERDEARRQTEAVERRLAELDAEGRKAVLVSHQVNISALTDAFPASGEMIVVSLTPGGDIVVEGRIATD